MCAHARNLAARHRNRRLWTLDWVSGKCRKRASARSRHCFERRASARQLMVRWFRTPPHAFAALCYVVVVTVLLGVIKATGTDFVMSWPVVLLLAGIISSLVMAVAT